MNLWSFLRQPLALLPLALPLLLAGCASFSPDGGFSSVEQATKQRIGKDVVWQRSESDKAEVAQRIKELLAAPLTADDAVQIALLNNRGLQAKFSELGIAESDLVQAGRLSNPGFTFSRLHQGNEVEIDRSFVVNLGKLLMMPVISQIEQRRFEQTQHEVTLQIVLLAAQTRQSYYSAVAAEQTRLYMQQVKEVADAGADLAKRMMQAGNFNQLQQAREQSFYAEATLNLARAEQMQVRSREKLTRLMGLSGSQISYQLPPKLPDLPKSPEELISIEQTAMSQRLDVQEARLTTAQLAKNLGLTRTTHFINVLDVGVMHNSFKDQPTENGVEVSLELPLFDWGDAKVAKAEALYMQAVNRTEEIAINAFSEVREAYFIYRSNYDVARRFQDEIVPLAKRISEENQLRYNGMLISVFELLADARSQIASVNSAIEANRDFWMAQAGLEMSLLGRPSQLMDEEIK